MARIKKILILLLFAIILCAAPSWATIFHVTQAGGVGVNPLSVAQFNSLSGNYPNDIFYFRGTITSTITVGISGTSGNPIVIRGDYAGDAGIMSPGGGGTAIHVIGKDYIKITELEIANGQNGIDIYGGSDHITVTNCLIHDMTGRAIHASGWPDEDGWTYLIIGGSAGNGNTFYDIGMDTAGMDINVSYGQHYVISYNSLYATKSNGLSSDRGIDGIHSQGGVNGLIEYNKIYNHNDSYGGDAAGEDGIDLKEGCSNVIIRFNHIYGHEHQTGITTQAGAHDIYIYGNNIHSNDIGILVFSRTPFSGVEDIYIWSNIIHNNMKDGGVLLVTSGPSINNVKIHNNTITRNASDETGSANVHQTGIGVANAVTTNLQIKNNIFYDNRPNATTHQEIYVASGLGDGYLEHNTYWKTGQTPIVYYAGGNRTIPILQGAPYNMEDDIVAGEVANPNFVDPAGADYTYGTADDDYTLTSVGSVGEDLSGTIATVTVQGVDYVMDYKWALDPNGTDWTTNPPTVATVDRDTYGWARGAYAFGWLISNASPADGAEGQNDSLTITGDIPASGVLETYT